ncbi:G2E3 ligase, partial [Alcedo cyanopectus]|nr:G2E3 ligase [Ceyx cyanopectus]
GCERSFHLPCAARGQCTTQYFAHYKSYCSDHSPEQIVEATPEKGTYCLICTDSVDDRKSYRTMVCPACKHAWFHRDCIQGQSLCAGLCFQCPLCRDREVFMVEMLILGIRITLR